MRSVLKRVRPLLDRLPHDTLMIGGKPYMRRWYLFGYAPDPEDVDKRMMCAVCSGDVYRAENTTGSWWAHAGHGGAVLDERHSAVAISASRPGWWWRDHGIGAVRVHEIVAGDDSRAFHDHPWAFLAIGLSGSYIEETPDPGLVEHDELGAVTHCPLPGIWWNRKRRFTAPFVNVKRATDLHVLDVHDGPVWTLFLTRPKTRSWGFAGPFGWMGWRDFDSAFPERDAWTDA